MKKIFIIFLLILASCSNEIDDVNDNNSGDSKNNTINEIAKEEELNTNCKITFESVGGDILELNMNDEVCNNGNNYFKSEERDYIKDPFGGMYTEFNVELEELSFIMKEQHIFKGFDPMVLTKILKNDKIEFDTTHNISIYLSADMKEGSAIDDEINNFILENGEIESYEFGGNMGGGRTGAGYIYVSSNNFNPKNEEGALELYEKFKSIFEKAKIVKENYKVDFDKYIFENKLYLTSALSHREIPIEITNYVYDGRDSYDFSELRGICMQNTRQKGCEVYKIENGKIYWGNEILDKNTDFEYGLTVYVETDIDTGKSTLEILNSDTEELNIRAEDFLNKHYSTLCSGDFENAHKNYDLDKLEVNGNKEPGMRNYDTFVKTWSGIKDCHLENFTPKEHYLSYSYDVVIEYDDGNTETYNTSAISLSYYPAINNFKILGYNSKKKS